MTIPMAAATVALWLLIVLPVAALCYFTMETFFGLVPLRQDKPDPACTPARTVVLIPAHNEGAVIGDTISALVDAQQEAQILVVADNCTDDTAEAARKAGAEVIERNDWAARGKGFALAFGVAHLSSAPPDVVVVLDADCRIQPGGINALAAIALSRKSAVQAANLVLSPDRVAVQVQISNFAIMVKNLFRARGLERLSGTGMLFGTGMAIPWHIIELLPLATPDMTEDIKYSLELARAGKVIILADGVRVTSLPPSLANSRGQRKRWEHGFLRKMSRDAPQLMLAAIRRRSFAMLALGMHMIVPPLALLVAWAMITLALTMPLAMIAGTWVPTLLLALSLVLAACAVLLAWCSGGREVLPLRSLLSVPAYIIWKIPIYLGFYKRPQDQWNHTPRSD